MSFGEWVETLGPGALFLGVVLGCGKLMIDRAVRLKFDAQLERTRAELRKDAVRFERQYKNVAEAIVGVHCRVSDFAYAVERLLDMSEEQSVEESEEAVVRKMEELQTFVRHNRIYLSASVSDRLNVGIAVLRDLYEEFVDTVRIPRPELGSDDGLRRTIAWRELGERMQEEVRPMLDELEQIFREWCEL